MTGKQAKRMSQAQVALQEMRDEYSRASYGAEASGEVMRDATRIVVMAEEIANLIDRLLIDVHVYGLTDDSRALAHATLFPDES